MQLPYWHNKDKLLLSVKELAELLQISVRTIYNQTGPKAKKKFPIKFKRIGRLIRFDTRDINNYFTED